MSGGQRQGCLADAAGTDHRHEAVALQQRLQRIEIGGRPNKDSGAAGSAAACAGAAPPSSR